VDTYAYFGEPFTPIRLKEGINDDFLTPFKVKQIATTLDDYLYTPDDKVIEGEIEEGKRYREPQFNRNHRDRGAGALSAREDVGVLRFARPCTAGARHREPDEHEQRSELLHASHGRRWRAG
jgi:type I site-specific restriction endonuclease